MSIPTIGKMLKVYLVSAEIERMKCGRPGEGTVRNTVLGVKNFRRWLNRRREALGYERIGFDEDYPSVSIVKPVLIHQYLSEMLKSGIKPITALTYVNQLRQLFARWMRPYYDDRGWKIPSFPSLGGRPSAPRYVRPSTERLSRVKAWYLSLPTGDLWFVATMMLEFAMRNGDILRLKRENFVERNERIYLNYMPHKTAHSSGRMVKWPVHVELWQRIRECPLTFDERIFETLNRAMRGLGFDGTKGAYELRKICIDHVYQRFGAEMAVSISGDDIKTIIHYYADPSQPNIGDVRITDLF